MDQAQLTTPVLPIVLIITLALGLIVFGEVVSEFETVCSDEFGEEWSRLENREPDNGHLAVCQAENGTVQQYPRESIETTAEPPPIEPLVIAALAAAVIVVVQRFRDFDEEESDLDEVQSLYVEGEISIMELESELEDVMDDHE